MSHHKISHILSFLLRLQAKQLFSNPTDAALMFHGSLSDSRVKGIFSQPTIVPGSFLIRSSDSRPGFLVLQYAVSQPGGLRVHKDLLQVLRPGGPDTPPVLALGSTGRHFPSIHDLRREHGKLVRPILREDHLGRDGAGGGSLGHTSSFWRSSEQHADFLAQWRCTASIVSAVSGIGLHGQSLFPQRAPDPAAPYTDFTGAATAATPHGAPIPPTHHGAAAAPHSAPIPPTQQPRRADAIANHALSPAHAAAAPNAAASASGYCPTGQGVWHSPGTASGAAHATVVQSGTMQASTGPLASGLWSGPFNQPPQGVQPAATTNVASPPVTSGWAAAGSSSPAWMPPSLQQQQQLPTAVTRSAYADSAEGQAAMGGALTGAPYSVPVGTQAGNQQQQQGHQSLAWMPPSLQQQQQQQQQQYSLLTRE